MDLRLRFVFVSMGWQCKVCVVAVSETETETAPMREIRVCVREEKTHTGRIKRQNQEQGVPETLESALWISSTEDAIMQQDSRRQIHAKDSRRIGARGQTGRRMRGTNVGAMTRDTRNAGTGVVGGKEGRKEARTESASE